MARSTKAFKKASLFEGFKALKNVQECESFLYDLLTHAEIKAMVERWMIARLLWFDKLSYKVVHEYTKVSITTITRVARFLYHENDGYKLVLEKGAGRWAIKDQANLNVEKEFTSLCEAIMFSAASETIFHAFIADLCAPSEIKAMNERWLVANYLARGGLSYNQIKDEIGVSIATITRVARFLNHEKYHGYRLVLERLGLIS